MVVLDPILHHEVLLVSPVVLAAMAAMAAMDLVQRLAVVSVVVVEPVALAMTLQVPELVLMVSTVVQVVQQVMVQPEHQPQLQLL